MVIRIPIATELYSFSKIFFQYTGRKIFILLITIFLGGISEGIGISMVIPLLNYTSGTEPDRYTKIIYSFFEFFGLGSTLYTLLAIIVLFFLLKSLFLIIQAVITAYIKTSIEGKLKVDFCLKYLHADYLYFISKPIGYFNNLITTEVQTTLSGLSNYLNVIVTIIYIIIYMIAAAMINLNLTILSLLATICLLFILKRLPQKVRTISFEISKTNSEVQSLSIQMLSNFKYLKATNTFAKVISHLKKQITKNMKLKFKNAVYNGTIESIMEPIIVIALTIIIGYQVGYKGKQISEIIVLLLFFHRTLVKLFRFQNVWQRFCSFSGSVHIVNDEYVQLDKHKEENADTVIDDLIDEICLRNIFFSYDKNEVLKDINISIPKNKTIGIVGLSGAGKTTLFDIITAMLPVEHGGIYINNIDYRQIDRKTLRRLFGYVTQEPIIFNDTIANNISLWDCSYDKEDCFKKINHAAELANCSSFVKNAPKGYQTLLGDKGINLSGGQRQRIAIARELYKEPKILIFDEATSALDTESENLIKDSIRSMAGERTMIIIAHRLSTIKDCDIIYVLHDGSVVERGNYETLLEKNGQFKYMIDLQN